MNERQAFPLRHMFLRVLDDESLNPPISPGIYLSPSSALRLSTWCSEDIINLDSKGTVAKNSRTSSKGRHEPIIDGATINKCLRKKKKKMGSGRPSGTSRKPTGAVALKVKETLIGKFKSSFPLLLFYLIACMGSGSSDVPAIFLRSKVTPELLYYPFKLNFFSCFRLRLSKGSSSRYKNGNLKKKQQHLLTVPSRVQKE